MSVSSKQDPSTSIFGRLDLYTFNFRDLTPLLLHQWYLSHMSRVVRFGKAEEPYPWMVACITTPEYQSCDLLSESTDVAATAASSSTTKEAGSTKDITGERQKRNKWKKECITLSPSTSVYISFPTSRVVVCLDISQSVWTISSAGSPFGVLTSALLSIVSQLSESTRRGDSHAKVVGIQLSIIAHSPELDETCSIWQGEITSESDAYLLQSIIRNRIEQVEDESFRSRNVRMSSSANGNLRYPESETFLRAIMFHMKLMPGDACPKAILLTSGSMSIKLGGGNFIGQFAKDQISLHVLVERVSCDRPVGFYSDVHSLRLLVDQTPGGSLKILRSSAPQELGTVCGNLIGESFLKLHLFGPAVASNGDDDGSGGSDEEEQYLVQSYSLVGATVDHLLSIRRGEGFRIVSMVQEKEHAAAAALYEADSPSSFAVKKTYTTIRRQQQQQQRTFTIVTITLEKSVSKLCRLLYEVVYRQEDTTTSIFRRSSYMAKHRGNMSAAAAAAASADATGNGLGGGNIRSLKTKVKQTWDRATATAIVGGTGAKAITTSDLVNLYDAVSDSLVWTKGPCTVAMRRVWRGQSRLSSGANSPAHAGAGNRSERVAAVLVQTISDRDKALAALLGGDFMPGSTGISESFLDLARSQGHGQGDLVSPLQSAAFHRYPGNPHRLIPSPTRGRRDDYSGALGAGADGAVDAAAAGATHLLSQFPTAKRLSAVVDVLEDVCALDKVTTFHMFLCCDQSAAETAAFPSKSRSKDGAGVHTQKNTSKLSPQTLKRIFDGIASHLPYPDSRRLTPLKCLYVISNMSREVGAMHPMAIDFGVLLVELVQRDDALLTVRVSKLAKCCGQLGALVKIVVKSFFFSIKASGLRAIKVKSDLSPYSLAPSMGSYQRRMAESCLTSAQTAAHFPLRHFSNLRLLLKELVLCKVALGFQLVGDGASDVLSSASTMGAPSSSIRGAGNSYNTGADVLSTSPHEHSSRAIEVHMFAVSPSSPSGIDVEALLQCRVSCSMDMCSVTYHWPRCAHDARSGGRGKAWSGGKYSANAASASATIEAAVAALIATDRDIFTLFQNVVPLLQSAMGSYPTLGSTLPSMPTSMTIPSELRKPCAAIGCSTTFMEPQHVTLSVQQWLELIRHADVESLFLPRFSETNRVMTRTFRLNYRLLRMLRHSLLKLGGSVLTVALKTAAAQSAAQSGTGAADLSTADDSAGCHERFAITVNTDIVVFVEFPEAPSERQLQAQSSPKGPARESRSSSTETPGSQSQSGFPLSARLDDSGGMVQGASGSFISGSCDPLEDSYYMDHLETAEVMSEEASSCSREMAISMSEIEGAGTGAGVGAGNKPDVHGADTSSSAPAAPANTCEVKLYTLQLPSLRFSDDAAVKVLTARAVNGPSSKLSDAPRSSHGAEGALRGGPARPAGDRPEVCALKDFVAASHMHNFATVLGTAMRRGAEVSMEDVLLGVDSCRHMTYEADISVMCRKRFLANLSTAGSAVFAAQSGTGGGAATGMGVQSLRGAFENTIGRILKGAGSGDVFVLKYEVDDDHEAAPTVGGAEGVGGVGGADGSKSMHEYKSDDMVKEPIPRGSPLRAFGKSSEGVRASRSHSRLYGHVDTKEPSERLGSNASALIASPRDQQQAMLAVLDRDLAVQRPAVFVRFAVLSKMDKSAATAATSSPMQLGGGGGTASKLAGGHPATATVTAASAPGGIAGAAAEDASGTAVTHPLACSAQALSEGLHALCSSVGQALEHASHSSAAATEVCLRMTYMYVGDEESGSDEGASTAKDSKDRPRGSRRDDDVAQKAAQRGFFDRLCQEVRVFVASDILNSLLASSSPISAETLVLVQHCLSDIASLVRNTRTSLDFVCPASLSSNAKRAVGLAAAESTAAGAAGGASVGASAGGGGGAGPLPYLGAASQYDPVVAAFETEVREQVPGLAKIGDTLYARSWQMRNPYPRPVSERLADPPVARAHAQESRSHSGTADGVNASPAVVASEGLSMTSVSLPTPTSTSVGGREADTPLRDAADPEATATVACPVLAVPCWILITLVHNAQPEGDVAGGTATTSMRVSVALRRADTLDTQTATTAPLTAAQRGASTPRGDGRAEAGVGVGVGVVSDGLQDAIAQEIVAVLERCSFRVNQRLLLRDLISTRVASPYLIAPPVAAAAMDQSQSQQLPAVAVNDAQGLTSQLAANPPAAAAGAQPASNESLPLAPPPAAAVGAGTSKAKSNIFNNSVPPRRRPPIPTLSVVVSKNSQSGAAGGAAAPAAVVPPKNLVFLPGRFSCPRQGEIHCAIHAWAALSHENAVHHLETSALSHFVLTNHERYFVSQDSLGHVVYLRFDPPERECVRLGVYGTHPLDTVFSNQLQVLLDHRLIEFTAKAVSAVLSRNASLHSSYMSFLKQSGASRHVTLKFALPSYVQDVYFFCTIVRQVFLNTHVLGRVALGGGGSAPSGEKKAAAVKSAAELMHPSSFGYNLLSEGHAAATATAAETSSSPRQLLLKRHHHADHADQAGSSDSSCNSSGGVAGDSTVGAKTLPRLSYAGAVMGDSSMPRKIFGDTPTTGLGLAARRSLAVQHAAMNRPVLVRKGHVEAEVADARIISPVFFGKKKNLSKPRREVRFDETLVVWQKIEFTFLYNVMGPATATNVSAQYRHGMKLIGQGLALIELSPQNVKSSASAFPSSASSHTPSQPLILLTGSQRALEDDLAALEDHVRSGEPFAMKPYVDPTGSYLPIPAADTVPPSAAQLPVNAASVGEGGDAGPASCDAAAGDDARPGSCSELHLRIYPTIPMQTQALADVCTSCLEKALVVYSAERLISACGSGFVGASPPVQQPAATAGIAGRGAAADGARNRAVSRENELPTPENSLLSSPLFSDFLRLYHGTLAAAPAPSAFVGQSSGILRFPVTLPRQKSQSVRVQVVDKLLDTFPALQGSVIDCTCDPLFPASMTDRPTAGGAGEATKDDKGDAGVTARRVVWCDTSAAASASRGTTTLLGLHHLSGSVAMSPGPAQEQQLHVDPTPLSLTSTANPDVAAVGLVSLTGTAGALSRTHLDRFSLTGKAAASTVAGAAALSPHLLRRAGALGASSSTATASDKKGPFGSDAAALATAPAATSLGSASSAVGGSATTMAGGGGDLRSLTNLDSTIISSLPLWLRKRNFSLEISVSTEGIFVFFFNLSPTVVNAVCEVCASIAAAGLRQHNAQLRQQLAMLGVRKLSGVPALTSMTTPALPLLSVMDKDRTLSGAAPVEASFSLPSSPLRCSSAVSPTFLSSLSHTVYSAGLSASSGASAMGGASAGPTATSAFVRAAGTAAREADPPADTAGDTEWLSEALDRLCWDQRTLERLFEGNSSAPGAGPGSSSLAAYPPNRLQTGGSTATSQTHGRASPLIEPLLRMHPRSWREGVEVSTVVLPLPRSSWQDSAGSLLEGYLAVVGELCDAMDWDLVVHEGDQDSVGSVRGRAFVVAPIPRTAVLAVAELSCAARGVRTTEGSSADNGADINIIITTRVMDIVDVVRVAAGIGLRPRGAASEDSCSESSREGSEHLLQRCREVVAVWPSMALSAEQTLQGDAAEGREADLLDWSIADHPLVHKLNRNLQLATFASFDRALKPSHQTSDLAVARAFNGTDTGTDGGIGSDTGSHATKLFKTLLSTLPNTILIGEAFLPLQSLVASIGKTGPPHIVSVGDMIDTILAIALPRGETDPEVCVLPSGSLSLRFECASDGPTSPHIARGIVLASAADSESEPGLAVIVAAYHTHNSALGGDGGSQTMKPMSFPPFIPIPCELPADDIDVGKMDGESKQAQSSSSSSSLAASASAAFGLVLREACAAVRLVMSRAAEQTVLQRAWTALLSDQAPTLTSTSTSTSTSTPLPTPSHNARSRSSSEIPAERDSGGALVPLLYPRGYVTADAEGLQDLKHLAVFLASRAPSTPLTFLDIFQDALAIFLRTSRKEGVGKTHLETLAQRISSLPAAHRCVYFTTDSQALSNPSSAAATQLDKSDKKNDKNDKNDNNDKDFRTHHIMVVAQPGSGEFLLHLRLPSTQDTKSVRGTSKDAMASAHCCVVERHAGTDDDTTLHRHQESLVKEVFEILVFSVSQLL